MSRPTAPVFPLVVVGGGGCALVTARGLLTAVVSLLVERGLVGSWARGLSSSSSRALEHWLSSCGSRA